MVVNLSFPTGPNSSWSSGNYIIFGIAIEKNNYNTKFENSHFKKCDSPPTTVRTIYT